jgi:hypothetical protein
MPWHRRFAKTNAPPFAALIVATTVGLALLLAPPFCSVARERRALDTLRRIGARADRLRTGFDVEIGRASDVGLAVKSLDSLHPLLRADVSNSGIRDADLEFLVRHPELRILDLSNTSVCGDVIAFAVTGSQMRELLAGGTHVGDRAVCGGIAAIGLTVLDLSSSCVTDQGVVCIGSDGPLQQTVTALDLSDTHITSASVPFIAKCRRIEHLNVSRTGISDSNLGAFGEMGKLTGLRLAGLRVSNSGLGKLAQSQKIAAHLEVLDVGGTGIDDGSVDSILNLRALREIKVAGTQMTTSGVRRLVREGHLEVVEVSKTVVTDDLEEEIKVRNPGIVLQVVP